MAPDFSPALDRCTYLEPTLRPEVIFLRPPAHTRSQITRIAVSLLLIHELPIEFQ